MAKVAAKNWRTYLDEFETSGVLNTSEFEIEQETPVVTSFSDTGPRRLVANHDHRHSDAGFFDGADGDYDEQVFSLLESAADHHLVKMPNGESEGNLAYEFVIHLSRQPRQAIVGEAILLSFESEGGNAAIRGTVLGSKTSTGGEALDGQNLGATASGKILAVTYRVISFTGTDITFTIAESSDDGGGDAYVAIVGLVETFTGIGAVRDEITIATEAWKRCIISGTYSSAKILITIGTVN